MRKKRFALLGAAGLAAMFVVRKTGLRPVLPGTGEPKLRALVPELRSWADTIAHKVSPARLRADVTGLPAPRNRLHSSDAMLQADELLLRGFHEAGWAAERRPFAFTDVPGYPDFGDSLEQFARPMTYPRLEGANIIATKDGEVSRNAIVVVAHHDTVRDSPGADDNTASVAALLDLARLLTRHRFHHTVILAATDMEELGLFGARALLAELGRERRILGVINFETMAYTSSEPDSQVLPPGLGLIYPNQVLRIRSRQLRGDFTVVIYNGPAAALAASFANGLAHFADASAPLLLRDPKDLPVIGRLLTRAVPAVCNFTRGDHVPFWEAGIPALFVNDTANFRYRHYHRPTDTPEKLNYDRLAAIVGATAVTIAQTAGLIRS